MGLNLYLQYFKFLFLVLVGSYYMMVNLRARYSQNWESTRVLCWAELATCSNSDSSYSTEILEVWSNDSFYQISVCMETRFLSDKIPCVSEAFLNRTLPRLVDTAFIYSENELLAIFPRDKTRSYFYNSFLIVLFSLASILLTFSFECNNPTTLMAASLASMRDYTFIVKLNNLAILIIGILMVDTARTYITISTETCPVNDSSAPYSVCGYAESFGVSIKSVITPGELFVNHYKVIGIVSGVFLILYVSFTYFNARDDAAELTRVHPFVGRIRRADSEYMLARRAEVRARRASASHNQSLLWSRCSTVHSSDSTAFGKECAICISPLFAETADQSSAASSPRPAGAVARMSNDLELVPMDYEVMSEPQSGDINLTGPAKPPDVETGPANRADAAVDAPAVIRLPCQHAFHRACIHSWFSSKSTCPVCRANLIEEEEDEEEEETGVMAVGAEGAGGGEALV